MSNQFAADTYELVKATGVHIADHRFGHNQQGALEVWIESSDKGSRFVSRLTVAQESCAARNEVYTQECYILRNRSSGRYWFLDRNNCGFWLQDEHFFGAQTFTGSEAAKLQDWLVRQGGV